MINHNQGVALLKKLLGDIRDENHWLVFSDWLSEINETLGRMFYLDHMAWITPNDIDEEGEDIPNKYDKESWELSLNNQAIANRIQRYSPYWIRSNKHNDRDLEEFVCGLTDGLDKQLTNDDIPF